ncbi:hypothetical protein C8R44DRAFT_873034 [Mycena epipterygia]|nr:hypothetical protein C8R44DRAFT_873034 [Mycena epipterygia]
MRLALLFNPTARVYTLRFLLLGNIATIVCLVASFNHYHTFPSSVRFAIVYCALTIFHHSLMALTISCLALGVPAFSIYAILIVPALSQTYTRSLVTPFIDDIGYPTENVTVFLFGLAGDISNVSGSNIQVNALLDSDESTNCSTMDSSVPGVDLVVQCPHGWKDVSAISISVATAAFSTPLWRFGELGLVAVSVQPPEKYINSLPPFEPIVLLPRSNLFGVLTWTERRVIEIPLYPTYVSTFIPEITSLQPYPSNAGGSDVAKLTLLNRYAFSTKLLQDTMDASPLSGISALGGFWSFVNGAFTLIFGANVVYFAFGRRPLSALGAVHIFQRRALARQWHRDFPALHSEGGRPGSESAGIVAFLRDRLMDLDSDSEHDHPSNLDAKIGLNCTIYSGTNTHVDGESTKKEDKHLHSSQSL